MSVDDRIWDAMAAADENVAWSQAITAAFGGVEPDEFAWTREFARAMSGPGPLRIRLPAAALAAAEEARLCARQLVRDVLSAPGGRSSQAVVLRSKVRPELLVARAKAHELRRSIDRCRS